MATFSARWWELYASQEGADECAKHITQRLGYHVGKACECMRDDHRFTSEKAAEQVYKEMITVLDQYADWGASDTEPRAQLRSWIKTKFNVEVY